VIALIVGLAAYRTLRTTDVTQLRSTAAAPAAIPAPSALTSEPASGVPSTRDSTLATPVAGAPSPRARPTSQASASAAERLTATPGATRESPAVTAAPATSPAPGDLRREAEKVVLELQSAERVRQVDSLLAEASAQRGRGQLAAAMATLARARELAPASETVRQAHEAQAIDWIRNVRFETELGRPTFAETAKAALTVVDASLTSATGTRRADLLAHAGWATYMLWRYASLTGMWGPPESRQPEPLPRYREALAIEPENPFANAMLAHWAFRRESDLPGAHRLFDTALRTRREVAFVRSLQWSTFGTDFQPRDDHELVRVADDMRRHGERLSMGQAQALYIPYSSVTNLSVDDKRRQALLEAVPPDDHIATVGWALDDYVARSGESARWTIRFIVALLHEKAGRKDGAVAELRALNEQLPKSSTMRQPVEAALARLAPAAPRNRRE
jgi:tetratricopeptide (TPR) repeat protein